MGAPTGKSFRTRLALMATGVCGAVLLAFSLMVWTHISELAVDRIDIEIERVARHHIQHVHDHEHDGPARASTLPSVFLGEDMQTIAFLIRSKDGDTVFRSTEWPEELGDDRLPLTEKRRMAYRTETAGGSDWRVGRLDSPDGSIFVAVDLWHVNIHLHDLRHHWLAALSVGLLLAFGGAWWLANRALRPVVALAESMEGITASDLNRRIPDTPAHTEFQRLVTVCNGMLERLERSFSQAVRFSADASHEMNTPLTIMQGQVQSALESVPEGSEVQAALATQLDEISRLKTLVRKLLLLAKADGGSLHLQLEAVDLGALVRSLAEDIPILAPELELELDLPPEVVVQADNGLLTQLMHNLVSNAIKYNRDGGSIRIALSSEGDTVTLIVENSGEPIPKDEAERLFDRFYRRDSARSRVVNGLGLGLSLSREIAHAHGGELTFAGSGEGRNRFRLTLPV